MAPNHAIGLAAHPNGVIGAIGAQVAAFQGKPVECPAGGIVQPQLAKADDRIQRYLVAGVLRGGGFRCDFQGEIGGLAHFPHPVGVAGQDGGDIHIKRHIAVGGDMAAGVALLVVDEGVAVDGGVGTAAEVGFQGGDDFAVEGRLMLSVGQGFTVRFGVEGFVIVDGGGRQKGSRSGGGGRRRPEFGGGHRELPCGVGRRGGLATGRAARRYTVRRPHSSGRR